MRLNIYKIWDNLNREPSIEGFIEAESESYNTAWRTATCGGCGYHFHGMADYEVSPHLCCTESHRRACPDYQPREVTE